MTVPDFTNLCKYYSPWKLKVGPGKVLEKSLNLTWPCLYEPWKSIDIFLLLDESICSGYAVGSKAHTELMFVLFKTCRL